MNAQFIKRKKPKGNIKGLDVIVTTIKKLEGNAGTYFY